MKPLEIFLLMAREFPKPLVLELGTKRSIPERATIHRNWVPRAERYDGSDLGPGLDVDRVADVHRLSQILGEEQYDIIIACSAFEHFKYPHMAAHQIMKTLRVGGICFVQTHQTFPLHAFPYDFFRFSREALACLFGTKMGFEVIATDYDFPAKIQADESPEQRNADAYLNVNLVGRKVAATPAEYVYEFDTVHVGKPIPATDNARLSLAQAVLSCRSYRRAWGLLRTGGVRALILRLRRGLS